MTAVTVAREVRVFDQDSNGAIERAKDDFLSAVESETAPSVADLFLQGVAPRP